MRGTVKKTGTRMGSQTNRSKLSKCCVCVYIGACVRACVTYFLSCLLEWTPWLLLFSCLEERGIYSRVATIRGTRTHTLYCPHAKNMVSQGKWTKCFVLTALCAGTMSRRQCGFYFGEILTATPEPKNSYKRHAVCVNIDNIVLYYVPVVYVYCLWCEGRWRDHWPRTAHQMFSSLHRPFPLSSRLHCVFTLGAVITAPLVIQL